MTDAQDTGATAAPAAPADTPASLAMDKDFQAALNDAHHPGHKAALSRQTAMYAAMHGDEAHAQLARELGSPPGAKGVTPLQSPDHLAEEFSRAMGLTDGTEGTPLELTSERPSLHGMPTFKNEEQREIAAALLEGIPETAAREIVATVEQAGAAAIPDRDAGMEQLRTLTGSDERAQSAAYHAAAFVARLPNSERVREFLEASQLGNSPPVIVALAKLGGWRK